MLGRNEKAEEKIINIEASVKGNMVFSSPVNLKISGNFEGELETKGSLTIAEQAQVKAKLIKGENITILGKVKGDIIATNRLELSAPAQVLGNIQAAVLVVKEGVVLKGRCQVPLANEEDEAKQHAKTKKKE